jgi:hypothetical protein
MLRSSSTSLPHHHNPSLVRALFLHIFPTYIFVSLFLSIFLCFFLSTILWFWFLLFSLLYPIILPHVQSVWSYYECPIPQQCCCLLFTKCMFCWRYVLSCIA